MNDFIVDPIITSVTYPLADWQLCRVFLYNDSCFPWGLLVPRRTGAVEICDLSDPDQAQLIAEVSRLSRIVRTLPGADKINVGCLGNAVRQMHVHVVGRNSNDQAWPRPVWGHSPPVAWPDPSRAPLALAIRANAA